MTCKVCKGKFVPQPDHRGKINVCLSCGGEDVPRLMAKVTWEDKQTPVVEIVTAKEAKRVAALQKRFGCGPLVTITESREPRDEETGNKDYGATPGATYRSSRGTFNVKR